MSDFEESFQRALAAAKLEARKRGPTYPGSPVSRGLRTSAAAVLGDPAYDERHRFPKWNVEPTVLMEPRLMHRVMPFAGMSKEVHLRRAERFRAESADYERRWHAAVTEAERKYGAEGSLISGGLRDHWPTKVKDKVRFLAHAKSLLLQAASAHWQAAGKRTRMP